MNATDTSAPARTATPEEVAERNWRIDDVEILSRALWALSEVDPEQAGGMAGTLQDMKDGHREEMARIDVLLTLPDLEELTEMASLLAGLPGGKGFYLVARNWLDGHPRDSERLAAAVPA